MIGLLRSFIEMQTAGLGIHTFESGISDGHFLQLGITVVLFSIRCSRLGYGGT